MTEYIILGTAIVLPVLLALVLRVHATHIFTAIVSGWLLTEYWGASLALVLTMSFRLDNPEVVSRIGLLVLPLIFTLLFLRKSMKRTFLLQFIPLVTSGLLFAALLVGLIPQPLQSAVYANQAGEYLRQSGDLIVGVSVLANLALMWLLFRSKPSKDEHGKHRK